MKKAVMLLPYIGQLPHWMDLFLLTASRNPSFRFVLYTDQPFDHFPPYENVDWRPMTLAGIRDLFIAKTGMKIPDLHHSYKLTDFKPTYGDMFSEEVKEPFWGHGDIDMLWGRMDPFFPPEVFENDVISGDPARLCGPFTLFRNTPEITCLYRSAPDFESVFMDTNPRTFDEDGMVCHLMGHPGVKLILDVGNHGGPVRGKWSYRDGKLLRKRSVRDILSGNITPVEAAYFHLHFWKDFTHDFDPLNVRGWKIRSKKFTPTL